MYLKLEIWVVCREFLAFKMNLVGILKSHEISIMSLIVCIQRAKLPYDLLKIISFNSLMIRQGQF